MLPFKSSSTNSSKRTSPFAPRTALLSSSKHARKRLFRLIGLSLGLLLGVIVGLRLLSGSGGGGTVEEMEEGLEGGRPKRPKLPPFKNPKNEQVEKVLKGGSVGSGVEITFVDPRPGYDPHPSRPEDEKYLAYLPHSGYHNQRIALTNALLLSHHLNRTLLLPPLFLGTPVPKREPKQHYKQLKKIVSDRSRLSKICPALIASGETPIEKDCEGYEDRSLVSWEMMVDLKSARKRGINYLEWWSLDEDWLEEELGVKSTDIKRFWTPHRYDYEIHLSSLQDPELAAQKPFKTRLNIDTDLAPLEDRVLWFGSMFGSKRLVLEGGKEEDAKMESGLKRDVALRFGALSSAVQAGRKVLEGGKRRGKDGNGYLGLHLRLNERIFGWDAARNSRRSFFTLLTTHLALPLPLVEKLDQQIWNKDRRYRELVLAPPTPPEGTFWDGIGPKLTPSSDKTKTPIQPYPPLPILNEYLPSPDEQTNIPLLLPVTSPFPSPSLIHCRRPPHTDPSLLLLNTPLYISTDDRSPLTHPALAPFLHAFPCVFFLEDLPPLPAVEVLKGLRNRDDGVKLWKFFVPFLDGLIASGGRRVLGTPKSTFSAYVVDVEWRKAWGLGEKVKELSPAAVKKEEEEGEVDTTVDP